ncbi:MAG: anti-sigma factor antagonist [candidate division Zixibacteria bacterium CG_4_9_14_3_um_filter_46_8]|nr:MAG: anti-sigma factor antagonist [candidate division Zixibacteria bacterium CG_4_9_14_3_um_filter_46_8]
MNISRGTKGEIAILKLSGRLDLESSESLKSTVDGVLTDNFRKMILVLNGVDFINSSGLGSLISILKKVNQNHGRMILTGMAPFVRDVFEITQLTNIFEIHNDENQAVAIL